MSVLTVTGKTSPDYLSLIGKLKFFFFHSYLFIYLFIYLFYEKTTKSHY